MFKDIVYNTITIITVPFKHEYFNSFLKIQREKVMVPFSSFSFKFGETKLNKPHKCSAILVTLLAVAQT